MTTVSNILGFIGIALVMVESGPVPARKQAHLVVSSNLKYWYFSCFDYQSV